MCVPDGGDDDGVPDGGGKHFHQNLSNVLCVSRRMSLCVSRRMSKDICLILNITEFEPVDKSITKNCDFDSQ